MGVKRILYILCAIPALYILYFVTIYTNSPGSVFKGLFFGLIIYGLCRAILWGIVSIGEYIYEGFEEERNKRGEERKKHM